MLRQMQAEKRLVLGHRGARAYAPMNTLPAFALAMEQGADGVELDVWRTADGHAVVIHDETVDATTNGRGQVQKMTLAELKALDAGGWFAPQYAGVSIPTLDEVFAALPTSAIINVEIKKPDDRSAETDGVEALVADCIRRHRAEERVIVSSFNPHALRHFAAQPGMETVLLGCLYAFGSPAELFGDIAERAAFLHPYHELLTPEVAQAIRASGKYINTWTVNERARMTTLLDIGVSALISDVPDVARAAVDDWLAARSAPPGRS
ncbi:MAG: glycerophosphodiester phosphodiesterase [Candidatus Flexifilum sp.]